MGYWKHQRMAVTIQTFKTKKKREEKRKQKKEDINIIILRDKEIL